MKKYPNYPFSALVGQEDMKRALILNVIYPGIGGVLIRGEKGTAKSTAVRALADVMPIRREVEGCRFSCDPDAEAQLCEECRGRASLSAKEGRMRVVNLPVSATEDRVVGTVDIEYALKHGEKRFEAGILADANRNILYVDEVNLLDDHVVDLLLDAAAMGVNSIEREGISYAHPSKFILIGTMNPEEGDLRPQLLDRFGLVVDVFGEEDPALRMEIVRRRLAFEADPEGFCASYRDAQETLGREIVAAQSRLSGVTYSDECLLAVAEVAIALGVDGHRADITVLKTAIANAAYRGSDTVSGGDLKVAARLSLPHRMRRRPFEEGVVDLDEICAIIDAHEI